MDQGESVLHRVVDVARAAGHPGVAPDVGLRRGEQLADRIDVSRVSGSNEVDRRHQGSSMGLRPTIAQAGQ